MLLAGDSGGELMSACNACNDICGGGAGGGGGGGGGSGH